MSDTVIKVERLSKLYHIGKREQYYTLRDTIAGLFKPPKNPRKAADNDPTVWALKDVSFEIKRGEIVGIIGRNGAGKSTLLKILSRVTAPTEGGAVIKGRVSSLLEVGTGFHPELTGRENIYLNAAILGMRKREIDKKFDEIVAFAEVEKFIDTPIKHYSSGMYMRLAFAVAAHLDSEILLVDEVLAVGDAEFQKKCLNKMGEAAHVGRTVLFVSHNMFSVKNLCGRAVSLMSGRLAMDGAAADVINKYMGETKRQGGEISWPSSDSAPGDDRGRLKAVRIVSGGRVSTDIDIDKEFRIEVDYWTLDPKNKIMLSLHIYNGMGVCVLTSGNLPSVSSTPDYFSVSQCGTGLFRTSCTVPALFLNDGPYTISIYLVINNLPSLSVNDAIVFKDGILAFNIIDTGIMSKEYTGKWLGVVRPRLAWETAQLN